MVHGHHHGHHHSVSRKLIAATVATGLFVLVELGVGFYANSLALIGNAFHDITDTLALVLALVAVRLERRPPTEEKSYGYQRAGVLAAFVNAAALVAFTVFIFIEAFSRFRNPSAVDSMAMLAVATVGLLINSGITFSLRREGREDINIRSAMVHILGDAISSTGIILAAILIRVTGSPQWDPAISVLIGILILWSSWGILREAVNLLLEGTPRGIDPAAVAESLRQIEGVYGVHHLHIWALGPSNPSLSCHLMVGDVPVRSTSTLLGIVNEMLAKAYRIVHATIQFEFANCAEDDPYCVPYTAR